MADKLQAVRGMNDILPEDMVYWHWLEKIISTTMHQYGFSEIRLPLVEQTNLFKRSIGEVTDIVEKEMYTFNDLNGDSLTLRPEGTAGCLRAAIEHGMLHNQHQKLWYLGPMFRHERPQKGRYRQFYQFGVEVFGYQGALIEAELIAMSAAIWKKMGIHEVMSLEINTLGTLEERSAYREKLVTYLSNHMDALDEDSKRRLNHNPLRILDSKNPSMQSLINDAPKLIDSLGESSRMHFDTLCHILKNLNLAFEVNPRLVRGLDYYGHTVFEWVTSALGSQGTVCAGGRYDSLTEQLGAKRCPAVGFAMGMERAILLLKELDIKVDHASLPLFYLISDGAAAQVKALELAEILRATFPEKSILCDATGASFKSQFKRADKIGASYAIIIGENELKANEFGLKPLQSTEDQQHIPMNQINEIHQFIDESLIKA